MNNTTGYSNSAFGPQALHANTIGPVNSAFGYQALNGNTTEPAIPPSATRPSCTTRPEPQLRLRVDALKANTTGEDNSAFGVEALEAAHQRLRQRRRRVHGRGSSSRAGATTSTSTTTARRPIEHNPHRQQLRSRGQLQSPASRGHQRQRQSPSTSTPMESLARDLLPPVQGGNRGHGRRERRAPEAAARVVLYRPDLDETHVRQYGLVAGEVRRWPPSSSPRQGWCAADGAVPLRQRDAAERGAEAAATGRGGAARERGAEDGHPELEARLAKVEAAPRGSVGPARAERPSTSPGPARLQRRLPPAMTVTSSADLTWSRRAVADAHRLPVRRSPAETDEPTENGIGCPWSSIFTTSERLRADTTVPLTREAALAHVRGERVHPRPG